MCLQDMLLLRLRPIKNPRKISQKVGHEGEVLESYKAERLTVEAHGSVVC